MTAAEIDKWVREYLGYLRNSDEVWKAHWLRMLIRHSFENGYHEGLNDGARAEGDGAAIGRAPVPEAAYPVHSVEQLTQ